MRDVIYVKLDIVYSINHQLNETISRKSFFFETVKSKVIISLFETVRLSVSISPRNLYNSLKSIKENVIIYHLLKMKSKVNTPHIQVQCKPHYQPQKWPMPAARHIHKVGSAKLGSNRNCVIIKR